MPDGPRLDLHEPGTVRALHDAVPSRGGRIGGDWTDECDGWTLLPAVAGTLPG
ncbi:hypothetical protein V2S66_15715 [Streptomyces sp. V4-01]|uniref:GNAT family N-acetyltransferase n=1 Tax=Actinacidiphila polyblastidii TaxID=3110430 RepID=A0ABU7PC75_9ACTN|nr:hypothetical protein [Streptomyces sp. V4-01]